MGTLGVGGFPAAFKLKEKDVINNARGVIKSLFIAKKKGKKIFTFFTRNRVMHIKNIFA